MPRPKSIAEIHGAKYDLRQEGVDGPNYLALHKAYEEKIEAACKEFSCSKAELLRVLSQDFSQWRRENKLPPVLPL